ncbi:MAG: hypothetical protein M3340_16830 [Actinomycetota bacterium]|nr:hypothetical protein [Actinomycetota bacterium]
MSWVRTVQAPDGRMWTVGRQWLPYRVRLRRRREPPAPETPLWGLDLLDFAGFSVGGVLFGIAMAIVVVLLFLVIWPLVALAAEIVLAIVLFLVALAGRVLFRRPWRIVARTRDSIHSTLAWHVAGWGESGRVIDEVADALSAGQVQPRPAGAERVLLEERSRA